MFFLPLRSKLLVHSERISVCCLCLLQQLRDFYGVGYLFKGGVALSRTAFRIVCVIRTAYWHLERRNSQKICPSSDFLFDRITCLYCPLYIETNETAVSGFSLKQAELKQYNFSLLFGDIAVNTNPIFSWRRNVKLYNLPQKKNSHRAPLFSLHIFKPLSGFVSPPLCLKTFHFAV